MVIGITGNSGSGKTTILNELQKQFKPGEICFFPQDNYYLPREQQEKDDKGVHNFDLPGSIDQQGFARDLERLIKGEVVELIEYTFNNPTAEPKTLRFEPAPIIVVEGIFVFYYPEIAKLLDIKIYVHAPVHVSLIRRIRRDQAERGYPLDDVLYRYEHHVYPAYERFIEPYIRDADMIINNRDSYHHGVDMLSAFIRGKLNPTA